MSEAPDTNLSLDLQNVPHSVAVFGEHDRNLRLLEENLSIKIVANNNHLKLNGKEEDLRIAEKLLCYLAARKERVEQNELKYFLRQLKKDPGFDPALLAAQSLKVSRQGKIIRSRGPAQAAYLSALRKHNVVFGIGPAGTGKTYLAMAFAINQLIEEQVSRIVLVRPVVEAGESLGFLPGDLAQKINPYLRPLYDAIFEMIGIEAFQEYAERGRIELAPLAYMRGRTLSNSVIVLDEAQNTTRSQMKMFLTRLGNGSRAVITGDITQIDLPSDKQSGLINAQRILKGVAGITTIWFSREDVVRHKLVQDIITAYEDESSGSDTGRQDNEA